MVSTSPSLQQSKDSSVGGSSKKRGWNEIESIFDDKKTKEKEKAAATANAEELRKDRRQQRMKSEPLRHLGTEKTGDEWVADGLGGKFNTEGFTGRVEDGVKIFKAHVLAKPNAGNTPECPFDCDCCYI